MWLQVARFLAENESAFLAEAAAYDLVRLLRNDQSRRGVNDRLCQAGTITIGDRRVGVKAADNLAVPVTLALKQ